MPGKIFFTNQHCQFWQRQPNLFPVSPLRPPRCHRNIWSSDFAPHHLKSILSVLFSLINFKFSLINSGCFKNSQAILNSLITMQGKIIFTNQHCQIWQRQPNLYPVSPLRLPRCHRNIWSSDFAPHHLKNISSVLFSLINFIFSLISSGCFINLQANFSSLFTMQGKTTFTNQHCQIWQRQPILYPVRPLRLPRCHRNIWSSDFAPHHLKNISSVFFSLINFIFSLISSGCFKNSQAILISLITMQGKIIFTNQHCQIWQRQPNLYPVSLLRLPRCHRNIWSSDFAPHHLKIILSVLFSLIYSGYFNNLQANLNSKFTMQGKIIFTNQHCQIGQRQPNLYPVSPLRVPRCHRNIWSSDFAQHHLKIILSVLFSLIYSGYFNNLQANLNSKFTMQGKIIFTNQHCQIGQRQPNLYPVSPLRLPRCHRNIWSSDFAPHHLKNISSVFFSLINFISSLISSGCFKNSQAILNSLITMQGKIVFTNQHCRIWQRQPNLYHVTLLRLPRCHRNIWSSDFAPHHLKNISSVFFSLIDLILSLINSGCFKNSQAISNSIITMQGRIIFTYQHCQIWQRQPNLYPVSPLRLPRCHRSFWSSDFAPHHLKNISSVFFSLINFIFSLINSGCFKNSQAILNSLITMQSKVIFTNQHCQIWQRQPNLDPVSPLRLPRCHRSIWSSDFAPHHLKIILSVSFSLINFKFSLIYSGYFITLQAILISKFTMQGKIIFTNQHCQIVQRQPNLYPVSLLRLPRCHRNIWSSDFAPHHLKNISSVFFSSINFIFSLISSGCFKNSQAILNSLITMQGKIVFTNQHCQIWQRQPNLYPVSPLRLPRCHRNIWSSDFAPHHLKNISSVLFS